MTKTRKNLLAVLATLFVAVLALCCVMGFAACGETTEDDTPVVDTATLNRVTAVATGDERLSAGTNLAFDGSSVTVTYDDTTKTYTLSGTSAVFGEDLAGAFWGTGNASTHASCEYIALAVTVNEGETIAITSYNGSTVEKTWTMHGTAQDGDADGVWIIDLSDHTTGDWTMKLEITYSDTTTATFTIALGTIASGATAEA